MTSRWIDITSTTGETYTGYLSLPPTGKGPGLVLIQEIWGVNEHIRTVADQYAADGFVVLAPDVFWRQSPRIELKYDDVDTPKAFGHMQALDQPAAVKDLVGAVNTLKALPEVTGKIATVGYCMGGRLSYLTAANSPDVAAGVAYYPGAINTVMDQAATLTAPVQFHFGGLDTYITHAVREAVIDTLGDRDETEIYVYENADHGFSCWGRAMYNQNAALLAHGRTLQFLAEHLA
ncbi:dienelactone hydrolase family protein [Silvimonas sp.]|uniref:dienelactone hydrolase family protein n=1 Tax=Silvimonas sp. TaxID=2650811 RepID=UPI00284E644E|nr:dienelactone hydrolase family protein [Silvimonas sp.]MDR3426195.1 dienelactone hydrolase family protein [Silvimonas sp.]